MIIWLSGLKKAPMKIANRIFVYNLRLILHNGSGFDIWVVLYNLSNWYRFVIIIKNGKGIIWLKVFNRDVKISERNYVPQCFTFRCGMTHINTSLKKMGVTYGLQQELLKKWMDHDNVYEETWKDKKGEWTDYVNNDVLCTAFGHGRYSSGTEAFTGFGKKNILTLLSLGWKYFNSLRNGIDVPIYTYKDKYMRWFVRQSITGGRCTAFNQYHKSNIAENKLEIICKE